MDFHILTPSGSLVTKPACLRLCSPFLISSNSSAKLNLNQRCHFSSWSVKVCKYLPINLCKNSKQNQNKKKTHVDSQSSKGRRARAGNLRILGPGAATVCQRQACRWNPGLCTEISFGANGHPVSVAFYLIWVTRWAGHMQAHCRRPSYIKC